MSCTYGLKAIMHLQRYEELGISPNIKAKKFDDCKIIRTFARF